MSETQRYFHPLQSKKFREGMERIRAYEKIRWCGHCGKEAIFEGYEVYDGCIGKLKDKRVMNACCGHDTPDSAYVQFWSIGDRYGFPEWVCRFFRRRIAGTKAIEFIAKSSNIYTDALRRSADDLVKQ